jgi:hypothetical protein
MLQLLVAEDDVMLRQVGLLMAAMPAVGLMVLVQVVV